MVEAFRKILVPVDMSPDSENALRAALELQRAYGSEIRVVTLVEEGYDAAFFDPPPADERAARLRDFIDEVEPGAAGRVGMEVLEEIDVPEGIERCAMDWEATLVILTTHHARPTLFRTQAERTIKALDVPVLLLKPHP
jgi:nucleotide-binding universal stress UspA family protein